jgi:L-histidine Nalpha-methyltransferase
MTTYTPAFNVALIPALRKRDELIREVQIGLYSRPRSLKPWMLYDERGSRPFEHITTMPEYYSTRTERSLLEHHADAIVDSACVDSQVFPS